jgi:hypothetical protein
MTLPIGASRALAAGILWGAGFAKTLRFGFPMLDVRTYGLAREGTKVTRAMVEASDGWAFGNDHFIEFVLPAIPQEDAVDPYGYGDATGWDSTDGWADFLDYARRKIVIRLVPNLAAPAPIDCLLAEPWTDAPEAGWNLTRQLKVVLRALDASDGTPVYVDGY